MCVCDWRHRRRVRSFEREKERGSPYCVCVCVLTAECLDGHGRMTSRRIQPHTHTANQPKLTKQSHTNNEKRSYSWRLFWKKNWRLKFFRSKLTFWWLDFFVFSMKIAEHFCSLLCRGVDCGLGIYRSDPPSFCNDARRDTRHTPLLLLFVCVSVFVSFSLWPLTLNMCVQQTPKSIDPFRKSVQVAERLPPPHTLFNARFSWNINCKSGGMRMCTTKQKEENVQISMHVGVMPSGRYRQCRVCTRQSNEGPMRVLQRRQIVFYWEKFLN